jgi:hypothetical protein
MKEIKKNTGSDIKIAQAVFSEYVLHINEIAKKSLYPR